jgi:hypothetical protein
MSNIEAARFGYCIEHAKAAYAEDVRRHPNYDNGKPRCSWDALCDIAKWSWQRNPTPRDWHKES